MYGNRHLSVLYAFKVSKYTSVRTPWTPSWIIEAARRSCWKGTRGKEAKLANEGE